MCVKSLISNVLALNIVCVILCTIQISLLNIIYLPFLYGLAQFFIQQINHRVPIFCLQVFLMLRHLSSSKTLSRTA